MSGWMPRRPWVRAAWVVGLVGCVVALLVDRLSLYGVWVHADSVAHLGAGLFIGATVDEVTDRVDATLRWRDALTVGVTLAVAVFWEVAEAYLVPYGGVFTLGWDDTTADVALVVVGAFVVLWLARRYRDA